MKAYLITQITLFALALLATLVPFFAGRSSTPRKDVASSLFDIIWITWAVYLLVGLQ